MQIISLISTQQTCSATSTCKSSKTCGYLQPPQRRKINHEISWHQYFWKRETVDACFMEAEHDMGGLRQRLFRMSLRLLRHSHPRISFLVLFPFPHHLRRQAIRGFRTRKERVMETKRMVDTLLRLSRPPARLPTLISSCDARPCGEAREKATAPLCDANSSATRLQLLRSSADNLGDV